MLVAGIILALFAIAGVVLVVIDWAKADFLIGGVLLGAIAVAFVWQALRHRLAATQAGPEGVTIVPTPAFAISETTLDFPRVWAQGAESWSRDALTAEVVTTKTGEALRLEHPQYKRRQFTARVLADAPTTVVGWLREG